MILARTVANTIDVDGMLDSMTPQQFDEWMTAYIIRPWGIEPAVEEAKPAGDLNDSLTAMRRMTGV